MCARVHVHVCVSSLSRSRALSLLLSLGVSLSLSRALTLSVDSERERAGGRGWGGGMASATKADTEAAQRVGATLKNIATQIQREATAWDALAESSVATLGRLHGILERIDAVRTAGGVHADTGGAHGSSRGGGGGGGTTAAATAAAAAAAVSDGSKDSRDAWGPLAGFRDLPQALHVALLRSAERLAVKLRGDLDGFERAEGNIAVLCAKARGSYRRHRSKLGLVAPSLGTATGAATLDYIEWITRLGRIYAEQLEAKHALAHASKLGSLPAVAVAMDEWEAVVLAHHREMLRWLQMMTYSDAAPSDGR